MGARRLLVLSCGAVFSREDLVRTGGSPNREVELPVPVIAIDTDDGWVLFDTGCDPAAAEDPEGTWGAVARFVRPALAVGDDVASRLAEHGVQPAEVKYVVISHLHMDHSGGIRAFPAAEFVIQRAELRFARDPDRLSRAAYVRSDYDGGEIRWREVEGDARVVDGVHVVLTDGHTPGHQSLVVDIPAGRVVLTGDAAYERQQVDRGNPPAAVTDAGRATLAVARLRAFIERDGAAMVVSHDASTWRLAIAGIG
jgi:N-acyl homoserine lactone hydrolase